jgi:hypothetical protein
MAGKNRWRPTRTVIDLPRGASREQTEQEAWEGARALVGNLVALGLPQSIIASLMRPPMNPATLRKHFAPDIADARQQQAVRVAATAYHLAVSGQHPAMTRFWLQTRAPAQFGSAVMKPGTIVVQSMPGDDRL